MKIYSWNMWRDHKDLAQALAFIESSDFDIFCLQEVPPEFLCMLEGTSYHIASGLDCELDHAVVLSRFPIVRHGAFRFPPHPYSWRRHAFRTLMRWPQAKVRGSVYADVAVPDLSSPLRIFSVHLSLSYPAQRHTEFEHVTQHLAPGGTNIIAGDFNILEIFPITLLNWLAGGTFGDIFAVRRERDRFEKRFEVAGLRNPLRGSRTHPISCSQLDHILIPTEWKVEEKEVINDRHGSDHHPVFMRVSR